MDIVVLIVGALGFVIFLAASGFMIYDASIDKRIDETSEEIRKELRKKKDGK